MKGERKPTLNEIYAEYLDWMRQESPWRWDRKGKLCHYPTFNILTCLATVGAGYEALSNGGKNRHNGTAIRVTIGILVMQVYLVWSQHKAHKLDFHDFVEALEKSKKASLSDGIRSRSCRWMIGYIQRSPKMRDQFGLIISCWPLGGLDMGICVREAWESIKTATPPEPYYMARMPNMVQ